jgi:hypothetical protein
MARAGRELVQISFELPTEEGGGVETLWALPLDEDFDFRLQNTPLFVSDIGNEDVVHAVEKEGELVFDRVVRRGGHSTYRVALQPTAPKGRVSELVSRLEKSGCAIEGLSERFFAVDVPPPVDMYEVYAVLQDGLDDGTWWFDELHVGHKLGS